MARRALSRLQDWLCPRFHLPPVFSHLLHIPWEGNREAGPRQAPIAFHSAQLWLLLTTGALFNDEGVHGRRETELLLSGGGNETKKNKTKPAPKPTHEWTDTDVMKLEIYSKWLKWNSSGPRKKVYFWWGFAQHSLLLKIREKVC